MVQPVLGTGVGSRPAAGADGFPTGIGLSNTSTSVLLAIFRSHMDNTADMGHF
jgi:hypothetical protein